MLMVSISSGEASATAHKRTEVVSPPAAALARQGAILGRIYVPVNFASAKIYLPLPLFCLPLTSQRRMEFPLAFSALAVIVGYKLLSLSPPLKPGPSGFRDIPVFLRLEPRWRRPAGRLRLRTPKRPRAAGPGGRRRFAKGLPPPIPRITGAAGGESRRGANPFCRLCRTAVKDLACR